MLTKNEINEMVEKLLGERKYSDAEVKLAVDYHLGEMNLQSDEKKKLDRLYLKKIEDEKEKIKNQLGDLSRFTTLVSLVSFSKSNIDDVMTELPIEKSLRVFENIDKIYLFYTVESKEIFENIVSQMTKKNDRIKIEGKEIQVNRVEDIYNPLKELLLKNLIVREKTIFDITLGIKMPGIGIYRLAVERGIICVNWKEVQLPKYQKINNEYSEDKKIERIPLTATLDVMQEPIKASLKNKELINEALEKEEYQTVAGHYERLGINDLSFFFNELAKVFSFENMTIVNPEVFYEKAEVFLEEIFGYKAFEASTLNKIKRFITFMLTLCVGNKLDKLKEYKWFNSKNHLLITKNDLEEKKLILERNGQKTKVDEINAMYRDEIYYYIILKYYIKRLKREKFDNIVVKAIKEEIIKRLDIDDEQKEKLRKARLLREIKEVLFENEPDDLEILEEELEVLDIEKVFGEKTSSIISFGNNIMNIEKYGVEIDFNEHSKIVKELKKSYSKPLIELLNREDEEKYLSEKELFILLSNCFAYDRETADMLQIEDYQDKKPYYTKEKSDMKKVVLAFNEILKDNHMEKDFFVLDNKDKEKMLKISEDFYKIEITD